MTNNLRYQQLLQLLSDLDDDERVIVEAELFQNGYCSLEAQTAKAGDLLDGDDLKEAA